MPTTSPANLSPSLPTMADKVNLGTSISIYTGDGLSVAPEGIVFSWGRRDGQPSASAINVATGSVEKIDSAALSPRRELDLEVSDPPRGRVCFARKDAVIAFDCCENERGKELRRSDDGGRTWRLVGAGPVEYAEDVASRGESIYWVGPQALWRSNDEGATWTALRHPALADGSPFSLAVANVDGAETLFLGTSTGQVLVVPAAAADWEEPRD